MAQDNDSFIREVNEELRSDQFKNAWSRYGKIAIGVAEAQEIERVLVDEKPKRPLTHELAYHILQALGASLKHVDVVDLRQNTFFAQIALQNEAGDVLSVVDARPSDAIALALRARCPIRVAEKVLRLLSSPE